MRASCGTRTPSVTTTLPSTFTHPFSIHSSASRREHRPSSLIRFERRGPSGFSCKGERGGAALGILCVGAVVEGLGGKLAVAGAARFRLPSCARRARDVDAFGAAVRLIGFGSLRVRAMDAQAAPRNPTVAVAEVDLTDKY